MLDKLFVTAQDVSSKSNDVLERNRCGKQHRNEGIFVTFIQSVGRDALIIKNISRYIFDW